MQHPDEVVKVKGMHIFLLHFFSKCIKIETFFHAEKYFHTQTNLLQK